jgi:DNA-binding NtrC family response regulator
MPASLLIIDDDRQIRELLQSLFQEDGYEIALASSGDEGLERARTLRPSLVILDIMLPGGRGGFDTLQELKALDPTMPIIMMTGNSSMSSAIEAMRLGAFDYVVKPFRVDKLRDLVTKAVETSMLSRNVRFTQESATISDEDLHNEDIMIGSSPEMVEIWKMVGKVADSDATVLIQGESGTGKELLARAIFNNSTRCNKPFLAVNCAALPENLLESELFGHEKGAFTDAHVRRIGKFEQCHGGTIFLDEISEMSMANQGKLLRVLENREFQRVGGNETITVDVRIISAANRSLVTAVKEKTFRMDLFYRLRVVNFHLPPLRERQEDIPQLVDFFVRRAAAKYRKKLRGVSTEAMELLLDCPWSGNIRELKNAIDSAVVIAGGEVLLPGDLALLEQGAAQHRDIPSAGGEISVTDAVQRSFSLLSRKYAGRLHEAVCGRVERSLIELVMAQCEDNQVAAAKLLGISRNTLRSRLEKYAADDEQSARSGPEQ